jgi:hypothetical protein
MIAKLHFGLAYGVPINEACERMFTCARLLSAAAEKAPARSSHTFAEKLKKAMEERSGAKQRKEQAERERKRYRGYTRKRTKGE